MGLKTAAQQLHEAVAAVAPISGVSVGVATDKATWKVAFLAAATAPQRTAGQAALVAFDYVGAEAAYQAANNQVSIDLAAVNAIPAVTALMRMTPAQIDTWVAANVTDIATARNAIAILAKAVSVIGRSEVS